MPSTTKRVYFGDCVFNIYEAVYEPAEDSFFFADNLDVKEEEAVLDIGTGCGLLGILAARKGGWVVAIDLNPYAIRCARENSVLNSLNNRLNFIQASLFTALNTKTTFDLVLFNAPYLPSERIEADSWLERSWAGGINGREVIDLFISKASLYLKPSGRILLMQSTLAGVEASIHKFGEQGFQAVVKAKCSLSFFETLTLIEAKLFL